LTQSPGTLYVVATPIGNLDDLTFRALDVLRNSDLVAAEDTRRTRKLLTHFDIRVKLLSYREQNREKAGKEILDKISEGRSVVLVTDAGTPGLSDPGHHLVRSCVRNNLRVVPVPGANALTTALSISGMPVDRFLFEGFLPSRSAARRSRLAEIGVAGVPFILYESPGRITDTLDDIGQTLGDREVLVAREMTKIHEEFIRGMAIEVAGRLRNREIRGEITIVVAGSEAPGMNLNILSAAKRLIKEGIPPSRSAAILAEITGVDRRSIYRTISTLSREDNGGDNG
jgi:16S rRNA (cytidine1402-2'-O)-methyltransferase